MAEVLADAPVAYWRLNDNGGSVANDTSGHSHTATINPGVTTGVPGRLPTSAQPAIGFDGKSGYVRDEVTTPIGPDLTLEAWVQAASLTEDAPVMSFVGGEGSRLLYLHGEQFRGMNDVTSDWPSYTVFSNASVDTTNWHHVTLTVANGTDLSMYIDGVPRGATSIPTRSAFSANLVMGWSDDPGFEKFNGRLADVAVYPVALSAERIRAHFAAATAAVGTSLATCTETLQSLIDAAPTGTVLLVPACDYRESISITKALTLDGQGHAEVRGSDVWTAWSARGSTWISGNTIPDLGADSAGAEYTDAFRGSHLEQAFVDGKPLSIVPSHPTTGQFTLDPARHVILATSPVGHIVEVTTRNQWVKTQADNVTITNFTFHHAASPSQGHAIGNDDHANFVLSNSTLTHAHGILLNIGGGDLHAKILNNTLIGAGDLAIAAHNASHALIQANTVLDSGWGGYDWNWQGGGMKFTASSDLVVDDNLVYENGGAGIWCDLQCSSVTYSNNRVHDNIGPGLFFEISSGVQITGNAVWSEKGVGILISDSANAEVWANTLAWNTTGISVLSTQRSDRSESADTRNYVHDNLVVMKQLDGQALEWLQSGPGKLFQPEAANRGANNRYWYPDGEDGHVRFRWDRGFQKLADFASTAGDNGGVYVSQADRDTALAAAGCPLTPPT